MKKQYLLFSLFLILFLFLNAGFACAALEITSYPSIPGLISPSSDCTGNDCLSIFIAYWFGLLVYIAGILSLISFTVGAVGLIMSIDNAEASSNAKDRMKGAVLGLVLTIASFLIIRTINPSLITPTLTPLPGVDGVFYTNNSENKPCPIENSDNSSIPQGFNNIKYVCSSGPALLIWMFPNTGFRGNNGGYGGINVKRITCNNQIGISGGSFRMAFETPGVYYCLEGCSGNMCQGYMSNAVNSSEDNISAPFNKNIKGIRIVNGPGTYYGVIFHKEVGIQNGGDCAYPIINDSQDIQCKPINSDNMPAASVNIFKWNNASSGNGVDFYSEPFGSSVSTQNRGEGFCLINNNDIKKTFINVSYNLSFDSKNSDYNCDYSENTIARYKNVYKTFQSRSGSINIKGNYLVVLYDDGSQQDGNNKISYCQVFSKDALNLNAQPFMATGHSIGNIYIIPIKK